MKTLSLYPLTTAYPNYALASKPQFGDKTPKEMNDDEQMSHFIELTYKAIKNGELKLPSNLDHTFHFQVGEQRIGIYPPNHTSNRIGRFVLYGPTKQVLNKTILPNENTQNDFYTLTNKLIKLFEEKNNLVGKEYVFKGLYKDLNE